MRFFGLVLSLLVTVWAGMGAAAADEGVLLFPNSDFEMGDLTNWRQEGDAFQFQPTLGDNAQVRDPERAALPQGNYYVGTYDRYQGKPGQRPGDSQGNAPRGGLISVPFLIEKPYISFLVGGGDMKEVGVRLLVETEFVHEAAGQRSPTMRRVWWDVSDHIGGKARIYIVDGSSLPWGIINADDFRAHDVAPDVAPPAPLFENSDFGAGSLEGWSTEGALIAELTADGAPGAYFSGAEHYVTIRADQAAEPPRGTLTSPVFKMEGDTITFAKAGIGAQVRLLIDDVPVLVAEPDEDSAGLRAFSVVYWPVAAHRGKPARIQIAADGREVMVLFAVTGFTWVGAP